jgi:hypothetical protein
MFIAWLKLRTRNLGPILDANGWAVNTLTRVNIPLGSSMTALPQIPRGSQRSFADPYAPKKSVWPRLLIALFALGMCGYLLYRTNVLHRWFPDHVPAHHTELELSADKASAAPGESIVFTVRSTAASLQVTNVTDPDAPMALDPLPVAGGTATLLIPAEAKPGTLAVVDAVSGTRIEIAITAPK